jgi:glycosyltransferase involved in cell wall biosynthesis
MATEGQAVLMIEVGGRGGVTDYTADLVAAIADAGWSVTLASATDATYEQRSGVRVVRLFHYFRPGTSPIVDALRRVGLGRAMNGLAVLAALPRAVVLARRANVVHSQGEEWPPLGVVQLLALRLSGRPIVYTAHNTFDRGASYPRSRELMYRLAARVIVHTQADADALPARVRARGVVIAHGEYGALAARAGAPPSHDVARAALRLPADEPVVLLFGRLRADKGIADLLAALDGVDGVRAIVAGADDGGLAEVRGAIAALGDRVLLREGHQDLPDVARLFAAADAVVLPYPQASASGVLLLAYGFARPVVVYPVGGLPEAVIDGETGWLCARADPAALADALRAVAAAGAAECDRRGVAGRALAHERYAWPAIAAATVALYAAIRRTSAATE